MRLLLSERITEESKSSWWAQVLLYTAKNHKNGYWLFINNQLFYLTRCPFPKLEDLLAEVCKYSVFSIVDLQSAYYKISIKCDDRLFTAFEASGRFYQFFYITFGVTNRAFCFQQVINKMIPDCT